MLTLLADINTGEQESSEWDLVLLPDFSLTVSVSHSVQSVGASNCSLGSRGQKTQPNKQTVLAPLSCTALHCAALRACTAPHARTLQAARSPLNHPLVAVGAPSRLRCGRLWQLQPSACAPATAPAHLHLTYLYLPAAPAPAPAPAPNFSRLFLDCVPPFPTWLPKSTFTLSRRLHYQMVRFLLSPPSLFSCRDVDEEEDWPPDTDRTLTPAPATTHSQPQPPERNRRPRVLLR